MTIFQDHGFHRKRENSFITFFQARLNFWQGSWHPVALAGLAATLGSLHPLQAHPQTAACSVQAPASLHGTLRIDAGSRAAVLAFPLGPGLGEGDLRYLPTLTGDLAPLVGLVPLTSSPGAKDLAPALLATSGFSLSPGILDWRWSAREGSNPAGQQALVTWTYPDGSRGRLKGISEEVTAPQAHLERFGYDTSSACQLPYALNPTAPAPWGLAGADGELVLGLTDSLRLPKLAIPGVDAEAPSGLLVLRGAHAYEYRAEEPGAAPGLVRYRLTAIRNAAGTAVTFTYGANGVDYEAAWGNQIPAS